MTPPPDEIQAAFSALMAQLRAVLPALVGLLAAFEAYEEVIRRHGQNPWGGPPLTN